MMIDDKCPHCGRDDEGDAIACDLKLKLNGALAENERLDAELMEAQNLCIERRRKIESLTSEVSEWKEKYYDLIFEVAHNYPDETRHETAKRYIHERENQPLREAENTVSGRQKKDE